MLLVAVQDNLVNLLFILVNFGPILIAIFTKMKITFVLGVAPTQTQRCFIPEVLLYHSPLDILSKNYV